jgi:hypothetical protein
MSWNKGFNFRGTSGFVADGPNCTYVVGDQYPTTRNGCTFGWSAPVFASVDANGSVDARLAGYNDVHDGKYFQVDLAVAGDTTVVLAAGDSSGASSGTYYAIIKDGTVQLQNASGSVNANEFFDANGATWAVTDWPTQNTSYDGTFATLSLRISCLVGGTLKLAHLFIAGQEPPTGAGTSRSHGSSTATGALGFSGVDAGRTSAASAAAGTISFSGVAVDATSSISEASGALIFSGVGTSSAPSLSSGISLAVDFLGLGSATVSAVSVGSADLSFAGSATASAGTGATGAGDQSFDGAATCSTPIATAGTALYADNIGVGSSATIPAANGSGGETFTAASGTAGIPSASIGAGDQTFGGVGTSSIAAAVLGAGAAVFFATGTAGAHASALSTSGILAFAGSGAAGAKGSARGSSLFIPPIYLWPRAQKNSMSLIP